MSRDACGKQVSLGDFVMLARTGKSAGISWKQIKVTRLTDKSFWYEELPPAYLGSKMGEMLEVGPNPLRNCIVVEPDGQA